MGIHDLKKTYSEVEVLLDSAQNTDNNLYFINTYTHNDYVMEIMDTCRNYINNSTTVTYSGISTFVTQMKSSAHTSLSGSDLDVAPTFLATFQHSAYLWMPVQDGGSGTGDAFLTNLESQNNSTSLNSPSNSPATAKSINWKSIAWSDGAGA